MSKTKQLLTAIFALTLLVLFVPQGVFSQEEGNGSGNGKGYMGNVPFIDDNGDGINDLMQSRWGLRFIKRQAIRNAIWDQLNVEIVFQDDTRWVDTDGDGVGDIQLHDYINSLLDTDGDGQADITLREYLGLGGRGINVDTDGDGTFETPLHQYIQEQLDITIVGELGDKMVDTDGDGVGDIALRDYIVDLLDTDGDGTPDITMREYLGLDESEIQNRLERFRAFREEVRSRRQQGMSPYVDEDGDGTPDNLPEGFRWRGRR